MRVAVPLIGRLGPCGHGICDDTRRIVLELTISCGGEWRRRKITVPESRERRIRARTPGADAVTTTGDAHQSQ